MLEVSFTLLGLLMIIIYDARTFCSSDNLHIFTLLLLKGVNKITRGKQLMLVDKQTTSCHDLDMSLMTLSILLR